MASGYCGLGLSSVLGREFGAALIPFTSSHIPNGVAALELLVAQQGREMETGITVSILDKSVTDDYSGMKIISRIFIVPRYANSARMSHSLELGKWLNGST